MMMTLIAAAAIAAQGVDDMRWHRRLIVVAGADALLARQRAVLDAWEEGAAERDITLVAISGDCVTGAADGAASLRRRYGLGGGGVVLVGKDGGVKLRSVTALSADMLAATIDAMPMRRAGR